MEIIVETKPVKAVTVNQKLWAIGIMVNVLDFSKSYQ